MIAEWTTKSSAIEDTSWLISFQASAPVNLHGIANHLGVAVWEFSDLPQDVSGKIFRDRVFGGQSGFSIGVNAREPYTRKRFTIAHELAHYILHRDAIGDGITDDPLYRSKLNSREEVEANKLAAEILMPYHLIQQLQHRGIRTTEELARELEVSGVAMKIRLGIPV